MLGLLACLPLPVIVMPSSFSFTLSVSHSDTFFLLLAKAKELSPNMEMKFYAIQLQLLGGQPMEMTTWEGHRSLVGNTTRSIKPNAVAGELESQA